jgi:serine/threonine protein kinase
MSREPSASICVGDAELARYFAGELGSSAANALEGHIEHCVDCLTRMSQRANLAFGETSPPPPTAQQTHQNPNALPPARVAGFSPGDLVADRYRITRFLGRGGMGEVYEAKDGTLDERVALKTVNATIADDSRAISRLKREVQLARRVTHPNVCRIFDFGFHRGPAGEVPFMTMELLDGETLYQRIKRAGRMSRDEAAPLAAGMAAGLAAAHRAGVIHRDFKSDNVFLVADGSGVRAVVTDFGLARVAAASPGGLTDPGVVLGTTGYMAPEQAEGQSDLTAAADIYALGVVLFEMVTGAWPFVSATRATTAAMRLRKRPPRARELVTGVDPRWDAAIARCLERRPADRFASAEEVAAALAAGESSSSESPAPVEPGERIGDYRIDRRIGEGGMGTVYEATNTVIQKKVALKILQTAGAGAVERFLREARAACQIGHPNIVDVVSFGRMSDGRAYIVMELLVGENLEQRLSRGPLPLGEALDVLEPICRALQAAHEKGIVHRDLKPANVFLAQSAGTTRLKLLDFGVAKLADRGDERVEQTREGAIIGTPRYMSPEQARGSTVDARADVYSLGVMAFEMFTGEPPFSTGAAMEIIAQHLDQAPPSPSSRAPNLLPAIDRLLLAMLAKKPDARPSLAEVMNVFAAARAPAIAGPPSRRRFSVAAAASIVAVAALAVAGGFAARHSSSSPPTTSSPTTSSPSTSSPTTTSPTTSSPSTTAPATSPASTTSSPSASSAVVAPPRAVVAPSGIPAAAASGRLHIRVDAADARVEVDGKVVPLRDRLATADVAAGNHRVAVTAAGRRPFRRSTAVAAGATVEVVAHLAPAAARHPAAADNKDDKDDAVDPFQAP